MLANIESSISHIPPKLKFDKNQINIVDPRIIVPAFITNPLTFSQACISTLLKVGILYWGSSIIKFEASPLNTNLLKISADITATTNPNI